MKSLSEFMDDIKCLYMVDTSDKVPRVQRNIYILKSATYFACGFILSFSLGTAINKMEDVHQERIIKAQVNGDNLIKFDFYTDIEKGEINE